MNETDRSINDDELSAFLDGELTPERAAEIEAWLAGNEPARAQVTAWRNQRELVKAALDPVTAETVPTGMLSRLRRPQWRRYLMPSAAAAAVAFAIGLGSGWALWNGPEIDPDRDIVRAGLTAHRMYAAEVRHAVEVGSDDEEHLVSWLSKRVDAPVVPPDLSASGLKLLGGRLLPVENGNPGAMLMYEGRNGERYTVFITRSNEGRSTSFHYRDSGQNAAYYWNDKDVGYVVSGPAERDELLTVARSVYDQLD